MITTIAFGMALAIHQDVQRPIQQRKLSTIIRNTAKVELCEGGCFHWDPTLIPVVGGNYSEASQEGSTLLAW